MTDKYKLIVRDDTPIDKAHLRRTLFIVGADVLLVALTLFAFLFFRYFYARVEPGAGIVSPRSGSAYVITDAFTTADNGGELGTFDFEARFLHKEPTVLVSGDTTYYYDSGCELSITVYRLKTGNAYVADIYINDISRLATALANDSYGKGQRENPLELASRKDALFSIPGDNYSERYGGVVMRNGVLYSREVHRDTCVLYWDGSVEVLSRYEFDLTAVMEKKPYQIWSFGPTLLNDGKIPDHYDTDLLAPSHRAAFGYYEPGHYALVVMEGSVTLDALSRTMQNLGCESAYALYGGRLAHMTYDGSIITGGQEASRACSDIIMITK